jgi:hypothetical protein
LAHGSFLPPGAENDEELPTIPAGRLLDALAPPGPRLQEADGYRLVRPDLDPAIV